LKILFDGEHVGVKGDAKAMIKEADTNNEGAIDFLSFSAMMAKKMANVRAHCRSFFPLARFPGSR